MSRSFAPNKRYNNNNRAARGKMGHQSPIVHNSNLQHWSGIKYGHSSRIAFLRNFRVPRGWRLADRHMGWGGSASPTAGGINEGGLCERRAPHCRRHRAPRAHAPLLCAVPSSEGALGAACSKIMGVGHSRPTDPPRPRYRVPPEACPRKNVSHI